MSQEDSRIPPVGRDAQVTRFSRRDLGRRAAGLGLSVPLVRGLTSAAGAGALAIGRMSTAGAAQEGTGGTVFIAQTGGDAGIGNPILVSGTDNYPFWWAFSRLVTYDDTGTPIPDLADSWTYNEAGTELTFTLNPNAKWHDGTPVTSADVLFTFDKVKDPATESDRLSRLQVAGEFAAWAAPDPQTVVLTIKEPFAPFLFALSGIGIIPKHLLEGSADLNTDPFNTSPVGSGPFRITEWEVGVKTVYERNTDYHRDLAAADGMVEVFYEDVQPALASLDAGEEMDIVFTPPESQAAYEDNPDFMLLRYVFYTSITLSFNFKHPWLQDIKVRQGIRYAIDKDRLAEVVTKGRNVRADNQFADTGPLDRYNDYSLPKDEYNIEQANALLDEAGWVRSGDWREKDGERFSLPILTYTGFQEYVDGQVILQEMLAEVGIELKPEVVDVTTLADRWADENDDPLTRPLSLEEYPHPYEQDPDLYNELHTASIPPNGNNYNYVSDPEIDRLIEEGRRETDDEVRIGIYHQLDARRKELAIVVPLYLATDGFVFSRRVGGIPETSPSSRWFLRCCAGMLFKNE